jgi:hypothetical protein
MNDAIWDQVGQLEEKQEQARATLEKLKRSLVIKSIVPDAFSSGSCRVWFSSVYPHNQWPESFTMNVIDGTGKQTSVLLNEHAGVVELDVLKPKGISFSPCGSGREV